MLIDDDDDDDDVCLEEQRLKEEKLERERKVANLDLTVKISHLLAVRETLKPAKQPILFYVESLNNANTTVYAWFPLGDESQRTMVLDVFFMMLLDKDQRDNLRTLTACFIGVLLNNSTMDGAKEVARTLLTQCFGSYKLGTLKRVIRAHEQGDRKSGEIDFYLLPRGLDCYTLLAR